MSTSISLLAFGNASYAYAAFNLAMSIKDAGCKVPIHYYVSRDLSTSVPRDFFDKIIIVDEDFYSENGVINVALSKINILKSIKTDSSLYLDVDTICLRDITKFIDNLNDDSRYYLTDVTGRGLKNEDINYDIWAKHEYAWPFFNIKDDDVWYAIQSSWSFFKKGDDLNRFIKKIEGFFKKKYPISELRNKWAKGQLPDELLFSGTCSNLKHDPSIDYKPMFFGTKNSTVGVSLELEPYLFLSMFGNGSKSNTLTKLIYQDFYSNTARVLSKKYNMPWYKKEYVMRGKIINF